MTKAAVGLLSGGLDSAVAAAAWLADGGTLALCLTFDYGQRAAAREAAAAQALAKRWQVPWQRLELPWLGAASQIAGSALVDLGTTVPVGTAANPGDQRSAAAVWVPARNAVFVAIGAAWAEALGAPVVLAGFNREEAATFPDNSPEFLQAATAFLATGTRSRVRAESPTLHLDKVAIAAHARRFGLEPADLWSCYRGEAAPCGECESCLRSARAFAG
ncbi:MAG: 7-cyano-7-deazaguanine synthase QueC [Planctomycetes bacterium]|nr:7-cyano-7-deazaguanine synthase QueC [Planctomycetota bacterium]